MKQTRPAVDGKHWEQPPAEMIRVWDPLVRLFHWGVAISFIVSFLTEDDFLEVHVIAGYSILGLITVRLFWGFVGPRYARWNDFVKGPREIIAYLKDIVRFRASRHLGHNPAGGAMVVALLVSLTVTGISGLAVYGVEELSGPLAHLATSLPDSWAPALEEVHEVIAHLTLLLVIFHLLGVAVASLQHHENLFKSMFTGFKRRDE